MPTNDRELIFYVGPAKSGSKSLAYALQELGILAVHDYPANEAAVASGDWEYFSDNPKGYTAFVDGLSHHFKVLQERFPQAKFIAFIRPTEELAWSHFRHWMEFQKFPKAEGEQRDDAPSDSWKHWEHRIALMRQHYTRVLNYFAAPARAHQFHCQRVEEGWEPLCAFLRTGVPTSPFPHRNKAVDLQKIFNWEKDLPPQELLFVDGIVYPPTPIVNTDDPRYHHGPILADIVQHAGPRDLLEGDVVLDIAGGEGRMSQHLKREVPGADITIFDINPALQAHLARVSQLTGVKHVLNPDIGHANYNRTSEAFASQDDYHLPVADASVDRATALLLVHHQLPSEVCGLLQEIQRILKSDGVFVFTAYVYTQGQQLPAEEPFSQVNTLSVCCSFVRPENPCDCVFYNLNWLQQTLQSFGLRVFKSYPYREGDPAKVVTVFEVVCESSGKI